jgi:tetratricopeptide (TPR) repeat protein
VWDARSDVEILTLQWPLGLGVTSVAFSPDGTRLAASGGPFDNMVKVWDARSGAAVLTLRGHTGAVASVAFSPDGTRLASAAYDNTVKVWDARTGVEVLTLRGYNVPLLCVAFSPDGTRLASGAQDNTVKLWDARSGAEVRTIRGHVFDPWTEDDQRRHALAVTWHADNAEKAARAGDMFAAAFHVNFLNSLTDLQSKDLLRRGLCYLRQGRRSSALADFARAGAVLNADVDSLQWQAVACLATNDEKGYRNACARILSAAGPQPSPEIANYAAWNCSLAFGAVADLAAIVALAEIAVAPDPRSGARLNTLGAALLRAGRMTDAIAKLEESLRLSVGPLSELAHNELLLAIANNRLGHEAEARRWLKAAAAKMDRYRAPAAACGTLGVGPVGGLPVAAALLAKRPDPLAAMDNNSLRNWLEMDILRAEAEAALANAK